MTLYRIGAETRVTPATAGNRLDADVTVLKDGGWVVSWTSLGDEGQGAGIFQQRFDRAGVALTSANPVVNATLANDQDASAVTALADGGWVVTWKSAMQDGDGYGIYQQRYSKAGVAASPVDQLVNVVSAGDQYEPDVTALADGGWVVAWTSVGQDGDNDGVFQRRFDQNGVATSATDVAINTFTAGRQYEPNTASLAGGGWIVTWTSAGQDSSGFGVFQQKFDAQGTPVFGIEKQVNLATLDHQYYSAVTGLTDGGWVVTWASQGQDGDQEGIYQRRYDASGNAVWASDRLVNHTTVGQQISPKITALSDGGWVVTWESDDVSRSGIFQRHFDRNGEASAVEFTANTTMTLSQWDANVKALPDGGWVVTWTSEDADGNENIYQQRFVANSAPTDVAVSGAAVAEGAAYGALVASLTGADANLASGDALTYTLLDSAQGRFALQGDKLVVADGLRLDYEQATVHTVTVRATDKDGLSVTRTIAVQVGDVARENLTGGEGADKLVGGRGADVFRGLGGNDTLAGGLGKDVLSGGEGRDIFVFDTKPNTKANLDTVKDFFVKDDSIWLDNAVFKKIGKGSIERPGKLKKDFFTLGTKAADKNDYVFYDPKKGALYYDADGSGGKTAIQIASLKKGLKMKATDFFVI